MTWVKLTDTFADDPRWDALDAEAFATHVAALCYCASLLTDGRISRKALKRLPIALDPEASAKDLVRMRFWEETEEGFEIVDYLVDQQSAEDVNRERERKAANMRAWRDRKRNGAEEPTTEGHRRSRVTGLVTGLVTGPPPRPAPPRPEGLEGWGVGEGVESEGASADAPDASVSTPRPPGDGGLSSYRPPTFSINGKTLGSGGRKAR